MKSRTDAKIAQPNDDSAEALAVTILTWLSTTPALMSRFLAISGIEANMIRTMAGERGFYGGLTEFLMSHEPTLLQFCQENDVKVEWVQACHRHFTGPEDGNWI